MSVRIATTIVDERTVVQVSGRLQSVDLPALDKEIRSIVGPRLALHAHAFEQSVKRKEIKTIERNRSATTGTDRSPMKFCSFCPPTTQFEIYVHDQRKE